jgi:hypothetical protein
MVRSCFSRLWASVFDFLMKAVVELGIEAMRVGARVAA